MVGVAVDGQVVHGQPPLLFAVVKVQVTGSIWLPAESRAPVTLTVRVATGSAEDGVKVTVRVLSR